MKRLDALALTGLLAQQAYVLATVPLAALHATEPTTIATVASAIVTAALVASLFSSALASLRRLQLALFLGGMPIIYAWCALLRGDTSALAIESIGLVVFGGLAIAGYLRVPLLLGVGIIAHGVAWDAWHHGHSSYVPDWYSAGCLVADLGIGLFALSYLAPLARSRLIPPPPPSPRR
ncbi:MAG: hypothetical protein K8W52_31975 [Deltaproteobacteria bacterium]|nr:hypothetical protein [Deltaproteobacteria bacterium]